MARDKDDLVHRLHQDNSTDSDRLRNVQKENVTLNHRVSRHLFIPRMLSIVCAYFTFGEQVKSLLNELDELRGQREKLGLESDHVLRLQSKQMTEFQANVRALEVRQLLVACCSCVLTMAHEWDVLIRS